ncbi:MAG TPA: macro domain-containing protein [Candidatus Copromorpha excrementigallinarum]|uniref:Macro domain-containing protein n=1 Tax=Candidatus Allocopromorpha excrementigallinarum TaxID=2840742 RepID=A0A9D1HZN8_9FIRM|nr:macro domain-containing protein [Candidatus Copromorpha excrementigallinarum]
MPFKKVKGDITKMKTDAVVNAANSQLLRGGGVCGAIFAAADSPKLQEECLRKAPCPPGQAVVTDAYGLEAKYIIHTVGPVWKGGGHGEEKVLRSAYRSALEAAAEKNCGSVAFPLISSGIYGYPREEALRTAEETIEDFLKDKDDMEVYLVLF